MEKQSPARMACITRIAPPAPLIALTALLVALLALGCSSISFDSALFSDDAWIAANGDSYSYIKSAQAADAETAKLGFSGFYGKHTVWAFESDGEAEIALDLDLSAGLKGRFKVCFVGADKRVLTLESKAGLSRHALTLSAGIQYIVVVGDAAYGCATLRIVHGQEPRPYEVHVYL
jgi:hypothetical protein